jgi:hypothetical protein
LLGKARNARNLHGLLGNFPAMFADTVGERWSMVCTRIHWPAGDGSPCPYSWQTSNSRPKKTAAKGMVLAVSLWDTWSLYFGVISI